MCCFLGEYSVLSRRVNRICEGHYSEKQIHQICKLRFSGWGTLSKEFLSEIYHIDPSTGEAISITSALYTTNENLMQLLSRNWQFAERVEEHNAEVNGSIRQFSYEKYC